MDIWRQALADAWAWATVSWTRLAVVALVYWTGFGVIWYFMVPPI